MSRYTRMPTGTCEDRTYCCELFNDTSGTCLSLEKYYLFVDDICYPSNCFEYQPLKIGVCRICNIGYYLSDGVCKPSHCIIEIPSGDGCVQCEPLFYLSGKICLPEHCLQINENGTCSECEAGYIVNEEGACI